MASEYDAYDAILHHIFKQTQGEAWFKPFEENLQAGVALRIANSPPQYRVFPYENLKLAPFEAAVRQLNPLVAVKVRSASVHAALNTVSETDNAIFVDSDTRIQILETMAALPRADKEQCAAFIRDERVLVCWSDHLNGIIPICQDFDDRLIKLVWRHRPQGLHSREPSILSMGAHSDPFGSQAAIAPTDRGSIPDTPTPAETKEKEEEPKKPEEQPPKKSFFGWRSAKPRTQDEDPEKEKEVKRPTKLIAPIYNGLGVALALFFMGGGLRMLIMEFLLDGDFVRFALVATMPFLFCVSLFFSTSIVTNLAMVVGPVAQFHENSKYYSAVKPKANKAVDERLPHVTIQMPVYKESLTETIAPSCESIKKAMQTYARQGGTSSILICDDGLQLLSAEQAQERRQYYADHGLAWVARPPHDNKPDGYKRAGRFKKASNMNYALELSLLLEKHLTRLQADEKAVESARSSFEGRRSSEFDGTDASRPEDEGPMSLEDLALQAAIEEVYESTGNTWKPWAVNGKAMRIGDIVLIVDSDTIVPEDCFRDAAREMAESPEVAIIQHESDVMQVDWQYFENGIAHFTRRINKCISYACANGEVAAFVGHNAFLRWSALQDAAFLDENGKRKIWSEDKVSEDFDMALRLQLAGYTVRWASYAGGGFKEGVSLTCDDELNRWEKYAFGCSELIFNPIKEWWHRAPITKQLRVFVWSSAPVHYKISMLAYMFSYYGIAAGYPLALLNYLLLGFQLPVSGYYLRSFEIWMAITVVFPVAGNIGFTLLEYRLGHRSILSSFIENVTYIPFFMIFFGGLSIHLNKALLAHMFSYNIQWGATKKEVERSNFFLEVPKILVRFRIALVLSSLTVAAMIVLAMPFVPPAWDILGYQWSVIFPLATVVISHILYPIALNPWLMKFAF
jgi:cellulose synthase/poly-beta-1,6-N-acetylglucosamine synthase-like glycosyltransferase